MRCMPLILPSLLLFFSGSGRVLAQPDIYRGPTIKQVGKNTYEFWIQKDLVARYNAGPDVAKPYFFPLLAPGGLKLTRSVPPAQGETADHPHQKSAWFCHGDVIP